MGVSRGSNSSCLWGEKELLQFTSFTVWVVSHTNADRIPDKDPVLETPVQLQQSLRVQVPNVHNILTQDLY